MKTLPPDSIRGRIAAYLKRQQHRIIAPVLELGSRQHEPAACWCNNRHLCDGEWIGVDSQPGENVDLVVDAEELPKEWGNRYSTLIVSEVLEHTRRPWLVIHEAARVLKPGGWIIVTVPFAFPVHGYPFDYWRITPMGLETLLHDAGFERCEVEEHGSLTWTLSDHGEQTTVTAPMQVFAAGQKPHAPPCSFEAAC